MGRPRRGNGPDRPVRSRQLVDLPAVAVLRGDQSARRRRRRHGPDDRVRHRGHRGIPPAVLDAARRPPAPRRRRGAARRPCTSRPDVPACLRRCQRSRLPATRRRPRSTDLYVRCPRTGRTAPRACDRRADPGRTRRRRTPPTLAAVDPRNGRLRAGGLAGRRKALRNSKSGGHRCTRAQRRAQDQAFPTLSPAERRVALLVADGCTNREDLAQRLHVSGARSNTRAARIPEARRSEPNPARPSDDAHVALVRLAAPNVTPQPSLAAPAHACAARRASPNGPHASLRNLHDAPQSGCRHHRSPDTC